MASTTRRICTGGRRSGRALGRLAAALGIAGIALSGLCGPGCGKGGKKPGPADPTAAGGPDAGLAASPASGKDPVRRRARGAPLLDVGPHSFSREDVALRGRVIQFKYGAVDDLEAKAAAQLIQGYLYACVLEALGKPITGSVLEEEVRRIDKGTQAPEDLEKIKEIFRGGAGPAGSPLWADDYAMIFVLPDFANRRLFFDVFPKEKGLQAERLAEANRMLARAREAKEAEFEGLVKGAARWKFDRVIFSPSGGFRPMPIPGEPPRPGEPEFPAPSADSLWSKMEAEIFAKLEKGKPFDQVVELETVFLILRWSGWHEEKKGVRLVERLLLEKVSGHEYYEKRAVEFPLRLRDEALEETMKAKIGWTKSLTWAKD
ncbi:MAG: hypothetical protein MUC63_02420 [Planctomycetes bacterium]|nr:hypothetical protein [Planctomycetota bacterium]